MHISIAVLWLFHQKGNSDEEESVRRVAVPSNQSIPTDECKDV